MEKLPAFCHLRVLSECRLLSGALLCLTVFPLYLIHWKLPQWMYTEFSHLLSVLRFLSSVLFIWPITCTDLHILNNCSYIPGANCTGSWSMMLLMCCWSPFASIALRVFSVLTRNIGLQFSLPNSALGRVVLTS